MHFVAKRQAVIKEDKIRIGSINEDLQVINFFLRIKRQKILHKLRSHMSPKKKQVTLFK